MKKENQLYLRIIEGPKKEHSFLSPRFWTDWLRYGDQMPPFILTISGGCSIEPKWLAYFPSIVLSPKVNFVLQSRPHFPKSLLPTGLGGEGKTKGPVTLTHHLWWIVSSLLRNMNQWLLHMDWEIYSTSMGRVVARSQKYLGKNCISWQKM